MIVLPGLMGGDGSTLVLRTYLASRGYDVHGWDQGRNLGLRKGVEQRLLHQLNTLADSNGPVSLVGWSLGGVYARILAAHRPLQVRSVITLGSPFPAGPRSTNAWQVYESVRGRRAEDSQRKAFVEPTPNPPTTSIFSRSDGVVAWRSSIDRTGPLSENIEVVASHLGLGVHPAVLYALSDRLSQPVGAWTPFRRGVLGPLVYPDPARPA